MADKWNRADPTMPDPHQHYPRLYSPGGYPAEIAAWHKEHDRWLKEQAAALPTAAEAVILSPGDTLIVRISPDRWSLDQAAQYEEYLNERLGVPVKLVAGDQLAVLRGDGQVGA